MNSESTAVRGGAPPDAAKIPPAAGNWGPRPAADEELSRAAWTVRWLGALAGAGLGLLLLLIVDPRMRPAYRSFEGIVGPPAFIDRSPAIELRLYAAGLALCGGFGWCGGMIARRAARRSRQGNLAFLGGGCLVALAAEAGAVFWGRRSGIIPDSNAVRLARGLIANPIAAAEAILFAALFLGLSYPGSIPAPAAAVDLKGGRRPWNNPVELALAARRFFPPFFLFLILLAAAMPLPVAGAAMALPLALLAERLLRLSAVDRKGSDALQAIERAAWGAAALAPAGLWLLRLGRGLHWRLPPDAAVAGIAVVAALLPLAAGWRRRAAGWNPALGPEKILVPALFWCLLLAGACLTDYDPFHQGEFTYPVQALRRGLLPWKDIFYVHGFGVETLGGFFMGPPDPRTHSLDSIFFAYTSAAAASLGLLFYLNAWGWSWWIAGFAFAALAAIASGPSSGRYLLVWGALHLVLEFLRTRRLRWLAFAGAIAWAGVLYSLDIGALLGLGLGLWTLTWGIAFCGRRDAFQNPLLRSWPVLAFSIGALALMIPTALVLWRLGILSETLAFHRDYALIKRHYDKLPFQMDFLWAVIGPMASLLGLWASWGIVRRREEGPLPGLILLLTILNILAWLRALDRSDLGHIAYGSMMTWPLLGSLAAWQARRGHWAGGVPLRARIAAETRSSPANGLRAMLAAACLIALPYAAPPLAPSIGAIGGSLVFPVHQVVHYFLADARLPLLGPVDTPEGKAFFEEARQLQEIAEAPGPWSPKIVRTFYDFSNQPAFYTWTGLTAPDRFFTTHYPSSEAWQDEAIGNLESLQVRWAMWRGPSEYWNRPSAAAGELPNWLHEWKIAQYLLRHYRPSKRLAAEGEDLQAGGIVQPGYKKHDALLLERSEDSPIGPDEQSLAPLWLEPADFGEVPSVWGRGGEGAPAIPPRIAFSADLKTSGGLAIVEPSDPDALARADEIGLGFDPPVEGRCTVAWENAAGKSEFRSLEFGVHENRSGPYRVAIGSLAAWAWGGAPAKLSIRIHNGGAPIERPVQVKIVARSAP